MPRPRHAALLAFAAVAALSPRDASAWRQSKSCFTPEERIPGFPSLIRDCNPGEVGIELFWRDQEVSYRISEAGSASIGGGLDVPLRDAVAFAIESWNEPVCSEFALAYAGPTPKTRHVADSDGFTLVAFVKEADWIMASRKVVALTTSAYDPGSGELIDADIEINERDHAFSISPEPPSDRHDLASILTHEAGHVLGLADSGVREATMFGGTGTGQTFKRDLAPDDIAGLCAIYPLGSRQDPPPPEDNGCCSTAPSPNPGHLLPAALALLGLLALRLPAGTRGASR